MRDCEERIKEAMRYIGVNEIGKHTKVLYRLGEKWLPMRTVKTRGMSRIRSIDKNLGRGLASVTTIIKRRKEARVVKNFDAILYSYMRDTRLFVLALCAIIGFGVWACLAPEQMVLQPDVLTAVDLKKVIEVVRDTFANKVCSNHLQVASPCECGEPINTETRQLFQGIDTEFDPLDINKKKLRMQAGAVFAASIILAITLNPYPPQCLSAY